MKSVRFSCFLFALALNFCTISQAQNSTCAQFGTFSLSNGTYTVQNNEWNSTATECISVADPSSFSITQSAISLPTNGAPGGYPSIYRGCHWGSCTTNSGLPLQVGTIATALSSWNTTQTGTGAYDVAYDIWFNQTPSTNGQPDGAELMIWLNSTGGVQPAGSPTGQFTNNGITYTVWTTRMASWNYIAYRSNSPLSAVTNLDIHAFINDAVSRGSINPAWYLIDAEAGFELWQGGAGLATNSFSFTASSASSGAPSISSISPTSAAAGTAVTITGANFGSSQGTSTVNFGSTAATVNSWSNTSISVSVPSIPAGATNVTVTVSGTTSNAASFTVTSGTTTSNIAISLQAISPNPSTVGTATNSTVNFTNEASTFAAVTIETELANSAGAMVASQSQPVNLAPQQTIAVTLTWSPTATGSYTVIGVVKDSSGAVLQQSSVGTLSVD